ncbi:MAG: flagellar biosynthesis anti-sigma factor FlgM [Burkholderiaceae bacterium]|jgi:negative regulator of flagellin synthesis FlgM|nr:flagellar biosynthesis anti-sigma factor FlgM [Burkholderiaceae bacterium]
MKIGPLENKANLATPATDRKAPASGAQAASPEPSAKVELSAAAGVLASVGSDGAFDAQKVERLSRAIRDGSFRIDADAIADKLIHNARELLQRGSN